MVGMSVCGYGLTWVRAWERVRVPALKGRDLLDGLV